MTAADFQLSLVSATLKELGYSSLASQLDAKITNDNNDHVEHGDNDSDPFHTDPVVLYFYEHIDSGNYDTILDFLTSISPVLGSDGDVEISSSRNMPNTHSSTATSVTELDLAHYFKDLTADELKASVSLMTYLIHRFMFLEKIVSLAIDDVSATNEVELLGILRKQLLFLNDNFLGPSPSQLSVLKAVFSPYLIENLSTQSVADVLLPLALQSPIHPNFLGASVFNSQVLLVADLHQVLDTPFMTQNNFDAKSIFSARLKQVLLFHLLKSADFSDLQNFIQANGNDTAATIHKLRTQPRQHHNPNQLQRTQKWQFPKGYLATLVENSNRYTRSKLLYYLPPRTATESLPFASGAINPDKELNDYYQQQFPTKLIHELTDHTDEAWFAKFSPSGNFLVSGSLDGTLIVYDVQQGFRTLAILDNNTADHSEAFVAGSHEPSVDKKKGVIYCCWDPQEQYLVACCLDTIVRVWYVGEITASRRQLQQQQQQQPRRTTRSMDSALSKNSSTVSGGTNVGKARLVSCFTLGKNLRSWSCEFLPFHHPSSEGESDQSRVFIIGSPDKRLKAFNIQGQELFDFYSVDDDSAIDPGSVSDGNITGGGATGPSHDASGASAAPLRTNTSGSNLNLSRRFSSHSRISSLTTPASSTTLSNEVNMADSGPDNIAGKNQFNRINDLTITPDGSVLITANNEKQIKFYTIPSNLTDPLATTKLLATINLNGRLTSCSVSSSGRYLLVSVAPEELQVWDISQIGEPAIIPPVSYDENHSQEDQQLSFGFSTDRYLPRERKPPMLKTKLFGHSQGTFIVRSCFGYVNPESQDEELVITGSDSGFVYFWNLKTGQLIDRIRAHNGLCNSVDWNRNYVVGQNGNKIDFGKYWCSVGDDKLVKVWGV